MNLTETSLVKMASGSKHVYDELSTHSLMIRLFRVEEAASGRLSIQLSTFTIDEDLPDYIALSYTWEPHFPTHVTQVNDGELSIGHNLWEALWTLVPLRGTFFWADQICINQQRTHELNHQVGFMHQIYNRATTVLIWLGGADERSDGAMQFISYITAGNCDRPSDLCKCKHIERMDDVPEFTCQHHFGVYCPGSTAYQILPSMSFPIRELFQRNYWSRVWVVQEIMFARNILVKCGNWTITWAQLELFFRWTTYSRQSDLHIWASRYLIPTEDYPPSFCSIIDMKENWGLKETWRPATLDLLEILRMCHKFECKLTLDRIYGLLGLVHRGERLEVDYDLTPLKLFIAVLHHIVKHPLEDGWHRLGLKLWRALQCGDSGVTYNQAIIMTFPGLADLYVLEFLEFFYHFNFSDRLLKRDFEARLLREQTRSDRGRRPNKLKPRYKEMEPEPITSHSDGEGQ